jgi:DNA-binding MarR family transcriptional regulator
MPEYSGCIVFLLAKAHQRVQGNFKKRVQRFGVTPVQFLILMALWSEEGLAAGELGRRLVLDPATLSGVLDRMADAGWIVKETNMADRRILRVYLSDRAREIAPSLNEQRTQVNEEVLEGFAQEESYLLKRML